MRVRRVISRRNARMVYKFPSLKERRTVYCESSLEFDYAQLLEFDQSVTAYQEQPLNLSYSLDGELHRYTPDFRINRLSGPELVETKMREEALRDEFQTKFRAMTKAAYENGYKFSVIDSDEIRREPRLSSVKLLSRYARTRLTPQHQIMCRETFQKTSSLTLREIIGVFQAKQSSANVVYALIYHGVLQVNLMKPLNASTTVVLPADDYK